MEEKDGLTEWNDMIEKMKNEKDGEESYLPMIVAGLAIIILITGFFTHFYVGDAHTRGIQLLDSLATVKAKWFGICMAIFSIPLFFASRTAYQKRTGRSLSTFIVLGLIAAAGLFLNINSGIELINYKKDKSTALQVMATIKDAGYTPGKSGHFSMDLIPEGYTNFYTVRVSREIYAAKGKAQSITVNIHPGYFGGKWLSITE